MTQIERKMKGVLPAIILPFDSELEIHEAELRSLARWLSKVNGVTGIVCNGHAGEVSTLSEDEYRRVIAILVDEVGRELPIYSGISAENPKEAVAKADAVREEGGSGVLLMPPHSWLRFGYQPGAPKAFFAEVARAELPTIVHQYPSWTRASYPIDTLLDLTSVPEVAAIKMGERNLSVYENHVNALRKDAPHVALLSCHDEYLFPTLVYGVDGALVGLASVIPELIAELVQHVENDDLKRAREVNDRIFHVRQAVYGPGEPTGAAHARSKEFLKQLGRISNAAARPPVLPIPAEDVAVVREAIQKAELQRGEAALSHA